MKAKFALAGFVVGGCVWAFLTGDFVTPWLLSFVVIPAAYMAAEGRL